MAVIIVLALMSVAVFLIYGFLGGGMDSQTIRGYASAAGFSGDDLNISVAIALAESKGDPSAYNNESQDVPGRYNRVSADDGLGSYGLWQIYLAAHPEFSGDDLTDPQTNANDAFKIYSAAGGFHAWSTFKSGAYEAYLNQNGTAA